MRRILTIILGFILTAGLAIAAPTKTASKGGTFVEGMRAKKPMIVLLYAPWSPSTQQALKNMASLKKVHGAKANFVSINIADPEAKYYNDLLPIQPNLPHITLFKDKAKISKFIPRECAVDYACVSKRVSRFVR